MKRIFYIIAGVFFLIVGLIGLALPVIPQVPFLVIAVLLLARASNRVRRWIINTSIYKKHLRNRQIKWLKELETE